MTSHPKRPRDPNQLAKSIIDIATGQKPDRDPTPEEQGKDPVRRRSPKPDTARLYALARKRSPLPATPIASISARPTLSAAT